MELKIQSVQIKIDEDRQTYRQISPADEIVDGIIPKLILKYKSKRFWDRVRP
jgi:hypothetical protein